MEDHLSTNGHKSLHYISVVENDGKDTRAQGWGMSVLATFSKVVQFLYQSPR